jgi:hypothetical protein
MASWPVSEEFRTFLGDLQRGTEIFVSDGQLKITLSTNSGLMYFNPVESR